MRLGWVGLMVFGLMAFTPNARAAESAEALFEQGLEAFLAGRYAEGCPLLERSFELDPLPGVAFTLAECQRSSGQLLKAVASYGRFLRDLEQLPPAQARKHEERKRVASQRMAETKSRIPRIVVSVAGGVPDGGRVTLNGEDISERLGEVVQVDPGQHTVQLRVGDEVREERELSLNAGGSAKIELSAPPGNNPVEVAPVAQVSRDESRVPTSVWILGGVGVAGVALGSVTGLMAASKKDEIDANCPNRECNSEGRSAVDSAQTLGAVSTISFIAGGAALGGALVLWFTRDTNEAPTVGGQVRPAPGGALLGVSGRF